MSAVLSTKFIPNIRRRPTEPNWKTKSRYFSTNFNEIQAPFLKEKRTDLTAFLIVTHLLNYAGVAVFTMPTQVLNYVDLTVFTVTTQALNYVAAFTVHHDTQVLNYAGPLCFQ